MLGKKGKDLQKTIFNHAIKSTQLKTVCKNVFLLLDMNKWSFFIYFFQNIITKHEDSSIKWEYDIFNFRTHEEIRFYTIPKVTLRYKLECNVCCGNWILHEIIKYIISNIVTLWRLWKVKKSNKISLFYYIISVNDLSKICISPNLNIK